jgi:hypothetical protein
LALALLSVPALKGQTNCALNPPCVFNDLIFPNPPGDFTSFTAAYGVNDSGTVVGYFQTLNKGSDRFGFSGATLTVPASLQALPANGSNASNPAAGINNSGTIVGCVGYLCGRRIQQLPV